MTTNFAEIVDFLVHSALWAIAQNRLLLYRPLCIICLGTVSHSAGSGSALWTSAQNLVNCYGPQRRICLKSNTNRTPCVFTGNTSHACGRVYMWSCISHACGHVFMWSCIHVHVAVYHAGTEFGYAVWAVVQNFVKCYGPQHRIYFMHSEPQCRILLSAMATAQNH